MTGATLVANDASKKNLCAFCLGKQVSSSCTKFAKTKERREVLQKYSKCFSCLQKGHRIKECRRAKLCSKCTKKKHHESLCDGEHDEKGTSEVCDVMNNKRAQEPSASVACQTVIVNIQSQNGKCTIKHWKNYKETYYENILVFKKQNCFENILCFFSLNKQIMIFL